MSELYPICRSITGNGVRETLRILQKHIPLKIREVKTGTKVFDWTVPKEWNIRDAYISDDQGNKIIDFKKSNLHVVSYSIPVNQKMSLSELKEHLHTIKEKPDLIPYVTSYYNENWGFCISYNQYQKLKDCTYDIVIDSDLSDGSLTYGEYFIPGKSKQEILLTCYVCHPSMCNDNLSGVVVLTELAKYLNNTENNYSIRFLFIPETIGAITWLALNKERINLIKHGLVATCLGDSGSFTYKKSRDGNNIIDEISINVLKELGFDFTVSEFFPWGSDERQFCSPYFNLPVGSLMRSVYGKFPEYHTSGDNLDFVSKKSLYESLMAYYSIIKTLESKFNETKKYLSLNQECEPQLGRRGIYHNLGGQEKSMDRKTEHAIFWILNLSDGMHSINDIVQKSSMNIDDIQKGVNILKNVGLLVEA